MPRANRHFLPGYVWHITHRCHKKEFLLKFARANRWQQNGRAIANLKIDVMTERGLAVTANLTGMPRSETLEGTGRADCACANPVTFATASGTRRDAQPTTHRSQRPLAHRNNL